MKQMNFVPVVIIAILIVAAIAALVAVVTVLYARSHVTDKPGMERVTPTCVLVVRVGDKTFYAHLEDNAAARAFVEKLNREPLTLTMRDYGGFEKVADLPWTLPTADERITAAPGDVVLYQGDKITLYYGENTWELTRLARIGSRLDEWKTALGEGDVTVSINLEWSE